MQALYPRFYVFFTVLSDVGDPCFSLRYLYKIVLNMRNKPYICRSKRNLNNMKESVRVLRFVIVGSSNALITASVIWILMDILHCNYLWSNMAGYVAALMNNFIWSKYWVFSSRNGKYWREIPLFLIAFGCAYATQVLFLLLLVEVIHVDEYLGQFLGLFVYGAVNFLMNKKITFRDK